MNKAKLPSKIFLFLFTLTFTALGLASDFPSTLNPSQYDQLFERSVKFCTMTKVHRKGSSAGGAFAHAVLFFKNACIDTNYAYPQIRRCTENDPIKGVGVSVNKIFKNVNWVAIPGQELFFYGDLKDDEVLNQKSKNRVISKVVPLGIYQGIQVKDAVLAQKPSTMDETWFKVDKSLDTDFAVNFGRDIYCANVPLTNQMLDQGIEFVNLANIVHADEVRLNSYELKYIAPKDLKDINLINAKAKESPHAIDYNWNGISENCAHLAYNIFAAMGLVPAKKIKAGFGHILSSMAVPSDRWVSLLNTANGSWLRSTDELLSLWSNKDRQKILFEKGRYLKHHGVIAEYIPSHNPNKNELFIKTDRLAVLNPLHGLNLHIYADQRPKTIYSLEDNLLRFQKEYQKVLDTEFSIPQHSFWPKIFSNEDYQLRFMHLATKFKEVIQKQKDEVEVLLEKLDQFQ